MRFICVLIGFWFALVVMLPHHTSYQVTDPAPAVSSTQTK